MFPRDLRWNQNLKQTAHTLLWLVQRRETHDFWRASCMFPRPGTGQSSSTTTTTSTSTGSSTTTSNGSTNTSSSNVQTQKQDGGCKSQKLMLQSKLVLGGAAGTFSLLPPLSRSLEKLYRLIDNEMQSIGAQKITMPCLSSGKIWKESNRWEDMGSELFKVKDRHETDHCLAPTHEELVASLVAADCPLSYKRLPIKLYQIGRKFRDERRPKNGLLRGREFEMKDLYIFDRNEQAAADSYDSVCSAYNRLFERLGLPVVTVEASTGSMGGDRSQEFHLLADVGEDMLYKCEQCGKGVNKELIENGSGVGQCHLSNCGPNYKEVNGIEIAHAFILGTKYTKVFDVSFKNEDQGTSLQYMSCYGIGVTRLLAAALELLSSDREIRWPLLLAPYQICVIPQRAGYKAEVTAELAERLCRRLACLPSLHNEVVLDDRLNLSIGNRVTSATEMGYPHVVALGKKALEATPMYEHLDVYSGSTEYLTEDQLVQKLACTDTIVV